MKDQMDYFICVFCQDLAIAGILYAQVAYPTVVLVYYIFVHSDLF
jgi:hypothetical protein